MQGHKWIAKTFILKNRAFTHYELWDIPKKKYKVMQHCTRDWLLSMIDCSFNICQKQTQTQSSDSTKQYNNLLRF